MNPAVLDIDAIVREVVQRLRSETVSTGTSAIDGAGKPGQASEQYHELNIEERLVTLSRLEGRLKGLRVVRVREDAIVTPAVVDELKDKGLKLRRGLSATKAAETFREAVTVFVASDAKTISAQKLAQMLDGTAIPTTKSLRLDAVIREVASKVLKARSPAVLVTAHPLAAACLANRIRGIRAAHVDCHRDVERAMETVAANLLVVDAENRNIEGIAGMVRPIVAAGHQPCPPEYAEMFESV